MPEWSNGPASKADASGNWGREFESLSFLHTKALTRPTAILEAAAETLVAHAVEGSHAVFKVLVVDGFCEKAVFFGHFGSRYGTDDCFDEVHGDLSVIRVYT